MEDNCVQVNNKNYCRVDWKKLFAPKCHMCSRPIGQALTGEAVIQLGRDYHPGCFVCRVKRINNYFLNLHFPFIFCVITKVN